MKYEIKAFGILETSTRFERMGAAAVDATPVMNVVADMMMEFIDRTFLSQGRRGGGSWKHLTEDWLARKAREGLDPRIGYANHYLSQAFTLRGAPHQLLDVGPHHVDLTTDLPYAETQQLHRPFIKFTKKDRIEMRDVVREYLISAWRKAPK
jgi:phage gpG-like protein